MISKTIISLKRIYFLYKGNPIILLKKVYARLKFIRPLPKGAVQKRINGVKFNFDFKLDPSIKWMYRRDFDIEVDMAMKRFLKEGDTFIDVGANIGYFSAIGAGYVGIAGQVHSFEPVPDYFERLVEFAGMNEEYKIVVNNIALGNKKSSTKIFVSDYANIGWNTVVPGFMKDRMIKEIIEVDVIRLDEYILKKKLGPISVIKIDVEGFEYPVLMGLGKYLLDTGDRPVIIAEIVPEAYDHLGFSLDQLALYIKRFGYRAMNLFRRNSEIELQSLTTNTNVLLLPGR